MGLNIRHGILAGTGAPPPPTGGYPNASNTGVPPGTVLTTVGDTWSQSDGQVFQNLLIDGRVEIWNNNVIMRRCKIINPGLVHTPYHLLRVMDDALTGFLMEDCEIDGGGVVNGIAGWGTFNRLNVHHCHNCINWWGPGTVTDSYLHDLFHGGQEFAAHFDTIEINGGSDIHIVHCDISNTFDQTSAIQINNEFAPIHRISVSDSHLYGSNVGYMIYIDWRKAGVPSSEIDMASMSFTNNRIQSGVFGYMASYGLTPGTWSGNVDEVTGLIIPPPS